MFNWSWELRKQTGFITPKGPGFKWALPHFFSICGTRIKIKVPRHHTNMPVKSYDTFGNVDINNLDFETYERNGKKRRSALVLFREWSFYGPWFTGDMGGIKFSGSVIAALKPTPGLNYFHPRALEAAISDYLTYYYGDEFSLDRQRQDWIAPINWRQQPGFPCIAARFDVVNSAVKIDGPHSHLVFPLTKTHYFVLCCAMSRPAVFSNIKPKPTIDEWIDPKPFLTLIDQVLNSVEIELSPQAKADQEEALRGLEDKELVKEFPPLKWVAPPLKSEPTEENEDDDIFLGVIKKTN